MIGAVCMKVCHVKQEPAARALENGIQKFCFAHFCTRHPYNISNVLENQRDIYGSTHLLHIAADDIQRFIRERQWRQVPDVDPVRPCESDVLTPIGRIHLVDQFGHLFNVRSVKTFRAPERKIQPVRYARREFDRAKTLSVWDRRLESECRSLADSRKTGQSPCRLRMGKLGELNSSEAIFFLAISVCSLPGPLTIVCSMAHESLSHAQNPDRIPQVV